MEEKDKEILIKLLPVIENLDKFNDSEVETLNKLKKISTYKYNVRL